MPRTAVIIPAFNEAEAVDKVVAAIPAEYAGLIVVVDNNSTDATAEKARRRGAVVLNETRRGYGYACLKGMEYLNAGADKPDIVVFLDGDYADYPEEMGVLVRPIAEGRCDMVIGSRTLGKHTRGAMTPWQEAGTCLIVLLIRLLYRTSFTDLGPFRAVRFDRLLALGMEEKTYGWTVEMQVKALKFGLRVVEAPVGYRRRIGKSKISGSLKGSLLAGWRMAAVVLKLRQKP
jgi:glycosyltransferase involved in cell wall biosynthesis